MSETKTGNGQAVPPTEVKPKATRRRFTAEYKARIVREADACTEPGEIGALLRREGLYTSHLSKWREQAARGEIAGLTPRKRGPKAKAKNPLEPRVHELEREVARLRKRAERAERLVELQKKVAEMFGETLPDEEIEEANRRRRSA
jgi:transposase